MMTLTTASTILTTQKYTTTGEKERKREGQKEERKREGQKEERKRGRRERGREREREKGIMSIGSQVQVHERKIFKCTCIAYLKQ